MLQLLNRCLHRVQYSTYTTTFIRGNKVNFVKLISRMSSTNIPVITDLTTKVKLNDGYLMPCYGLGVYMASSGVDKEAENATLFALQNGYRLIDTAQFYENEADVGRAVKRCGIPREEIFIVTKLWHHGYDECKQSFLKSLSKLDSTYVDLFLIHSPQGGKVLESYDAMIELQKQGLIRSIGVSNFNVLHLEELRKAGKPTPAVNQIELHPYCQQQEIVDYCQKHNIAVMGFTPLTRGVKINDPPLVEIAKKYNRSTAQILLRWSIQNGYITIPKSIKEERILENTKVFDFSLADEDLIKMHTFPQERCTKATTEHPWEG